MHVLAKKCVKKFQETRTLNSHSAKIGAAIVEFDVRRQMFLHPGEIFFRASGVYDEQKTLLADAVYDQVINDSGAVIEEKSVLAGTDIELVDVVSQHSVEPFARSTSFDNQLSHVRDIENTDGISHGLMFLHDAGVLHRHEPPGEWNYSRAELYVPFIKWRFLRRGFTHAGKLEFRDRVRNAVRRQGRLKRVYLENETREPYAGATMSWLDKLERRLGFLGIPGLIRIVIGFTALVWALMWLNPNFRSALDLDPARIRHGEVWRLVTYIFIPQTQSPLWIIFALWFLWWIGEGLEQAWGAFRLSLYFFAGMIGTTAAAFFFGARFSNSMLYASLFFAFARFYPDQVIYLLFILPVKIKWVAWVSGFFFLFGFVVGSGSYRMALVAALSNYVIFFGPEIIYEARHRGEVSARRKRYAQSSRSETEPLHKCAVCGATELSDANLDFRISRDGEEYCMAHLPKAETPAR